MKAKRFLCLAAAVAMTASFAAVLAGCGDKKGDDQITVTWYDGRTELKSEKIDKGSKPVSWTPTKTGDYEFKGWYTESSLTTAYDFTKEVNEDTDIFAKFMSTAFVADETVYYAVGFGAGDMKYNAHDDDEDGWDQTYAAEQLTFVRDTTQTTKNVYKLTLTLYAGDSFQIIHDEDWAGQMGIGYVVGNEQNPDAVEADSNYWWVKDESGKAVFQTPKGFGDSAGVWNITCANGADGIYEFTLTTYPGQASNNTIDWELKESISPLAETHKMYFVGTLDTSNPNSWTVPSEDADRIYLTKGADNKTFTGFITITEANYVTSWGDGQDGKAYIKVKNAIGSQNDYGIGSDNVPLTEGTWCVTYNSETNEVKYEKCEYYVVGTFLDGANQVNFGIKEGVTPKLEKQQDGTYTATVNATDVTSSYTWIAEQNKPGVFAVKVVFGTSLGIKDWYDDSDHGGDNFYLAAGSHTVTLNLTVTEGNKVTVS